MRPGPCCHRIKADFDFSRWIPDTECLAYLAGVADVQHHVVKDAEVVALDLGDGISLFCWLILRSLIQPPATPGS